MSRSLPKAGVSFGGWVAHAFAIGLLLVLAVAAIGIPLFDAKRVLSSAVGDVASQFLYTRGFGFTEMQGGNLPLWNPYLYGGVPFLGDFQSALLYPLNLLFLILPISSGISWSFALHIFLLGAAMYAWAVAGRGLRPVAAFVAGAGGMFCAPVFLHIQAGHLSNVCSMAWAPLLFLGIDGWLKRRHAAWLILAASASALQIYAGHPQYAYYTGLIAALYALLHWFGAPHPKAAAAGLLVIFPLAACLAAAQLLPGLGAASESVRASGTGYAFASMFSFPPENFVTLVAPWFFGQSLGALPYWGRCYLWEMCLYSGCGVLVLAFFGAGGRGWKSAPWRLVALIVLALLLALGAHTPLHRLLYGILPGFDMFRGTSKFIFFAGLFIALLAGIGCERLLAGERPRLAALAGALLGMLLLAGAWWLSTGHGAAALSRAFPALAATREIYYQAGFFAEKENLLAAQQVAVKSLLWGGGLLLGFAVLLLTSRWKAARWLIVPAAVVEIALFAHSTIMSFSFEDASYAPVAEALRKIPGDFRIVNLFNPDSTIALKREGIWGMDPSALRRYSRLVRQSQGVPLDDPTGFLPFRQSHPVLDLLRCRIAAIPQGQGVELLPVGSPGQRYFLVWEYEVLSPEKILEKLKEPLFDLGRKVLLEEEPNPAPSKKPEVSKVSLIDYSTDHQTVEVLNSEPAILVISDAYSKDWRVTALPGSAQITYRMLPADYGIRAVPLSEGRHVLRMQYVPAGLGIGTLVTLVALAACALALGLRPLNRLLQFPAA